MTWEAGAIQPASGGNGKRGDECPRTSEPHTCYETQGCCGETGRVLLSGGRPCRVPTGCGGAPIRPASSTGPSLINNADRIVCTDAPPGAFAHPTGLPRGHMDAECAASAGASPSGRADLHIQNSTECSHVSGTRVRHVQQEYMCHRTPAARKKDARLAVSDRQYFMVYVLNAFKGAMKEASAHPTEARRRQKARAKSGHIPKGKAQIVKQHFDYSGRISPRHS